MGEPATDGLDVGYDGYQIDTHRKTMCIFWLMIGNILSRVCFDVNTYPLGVKSDTIGKVQFMVDATGV
jgi:hypothetical protein